MPDVVVLGGHRLLTRSGESAAPDNAPRPMSAFAGRGSPAGPRWWFAVSTDGGTTDVLDPACRQAERGRPRRAGARRGGRLPVRPAGVDRRVVACGQRVVRPGVGPGDR